MKQQLIQSREVLISHLEQKVEELKKQRKQMMNGKVNQQSEVNGHVNIKDYLKKQNIEGQRINTTKYRQPSRPTKNNFMVPVEPVRSKADIIREQRETKEKIAQLSEVYNRKKQLESIGIYENSTGNINNMYASQGMRKKIQKKVYESKINGQVKAERDKVIKEELEKVEQFLKENKQGKKRIKEVPQNHYTRVITQSTKLKVYDGLIKKLGLSLVEKQKLLECTFVILKNYANNLQKEKLKIYLLSNPQFCDKFYITKTEIMRDLEVYVPGSQGVLTYEEFYQFIKSIQITSKALKPSICFKANEKVVNKTRNIDVHKNQSKLQNRREMQKYLKSLFQYFDSKYERIIQRQRFELALKKGLLFDEKKYKLIKKVQIINFGQKLVERKKKVDQRDYYKNLDLKYLGLQEILELYKKVQNQQRNDQSGSNIGTVSEEQSQHDYIQTQFDQNEEQEISFKPVQQIPKQQLQNGDVQKYGWNKNQKDKQEFHSLKQMDKHSEKDKK